MKKLISLVLILLASLSVKAGTIKDNIQGVWSNDTINLTFGKDTIYIDDKTNNEGFCYEYQELKGDTILCHNSINNDTFKLVIVSLTKLELVCYMEDRPEYIVELIRKDNN